MTFDQYILTLGIAESEQYSVKEVAGKLDLAPSTIEYWCRVGLRLDGSRVPIILKHFYKGRSPVIPGSCLVDFLRLRNDGAL